MFKNNKYTTTYYKIVNRAKARETTTPTEAHHIIPKSFYTKYSGWIEADPNTSENLVNLTPREHFICHWLLPKMTSDTKATYMMWNALGCFMFRKGSAGIREKVTPKKYEILKRKISEAQSKRLKGREISPEWREKLRQANLGKKRTAESVAKQVKALTGRVRPPRTEQWVDAQRATILANRVTCEVCGKNVTKSALTRFHGANCKHKRINKHKRDLQ